MSEGATSVRSAEATAGDRAVLDGPVGVDALDGGVMGEAAIVGLSQRIDGLEAARVRALVGFFAADGHRVEGFPTRASWMRARLGLTEPAARGLLVRVARMTSWPTMRDLWRDGALTGAQVELVCARIPKGLVDLYAEHDGECSPVLVGLSLADTRVVIDEWVCRAEAVTAPDPSSLADQPEQAVGEVHVSRTLADRAAMSGDFDPVAATIVETALRAAEREDGPGEVRTAAQRRAEAWVRIAGFFLDHHQSRAGRPGRQHPHVLVTVDLDDLAAAVLWGAGITTAEGLATWCAHHGYSAATEAFLTHGLAHGSGSFTTLEGRSLPAQVAVELFGAGTTLARLLTVEGRVLDHGQAIRLASPTLRDAVLARDGTCRFPGCDSPAGWADTHHVTRWVDGGATSITNLVALCGAHHGLVHRTGHGLTVTADGTATFTFPDRPDVESPPPRRHRPPPLPLRHPTLDTLTPHPWHPPDSDTDADLVEAARRRALRLVCAA